MKSKKLFSALCLTGVILSSSISVFGATDIQPQTTDLAVAYEETIETPTSGTIGAYPTSRLSPTTKTVQLSSKGFTEVYNDDNWTDVTLLLTNNTGNPYPVRFQVTTKDASGNMITLFNSTNVTPGLSWPTPKIASTYGTYYVKAIAVNNEANGGAADYKISYDDF